MTEVTKFSQTNWKSLSKAKSADVPFVTTKPCGHEGTLDGRNPKPSYAGNAKPWTPGITSEVRNAKIWNVKPRKQARNAKPRMPGTQPRVLEKPNIGG